MTAGVATITTFETLNLAIGDAVTVDNVEAHFDGPG
jgi:hypothetical protein